MQGVAYSFDFKTLLDISQDPNANTALADFSVVDVLPQGLTLATDGVLSGIPATVNPAGSSFQVVANYKTKTGQQAYTIVVNGVTLQVTQISGGSAHTCAVTTAGGAKCWGDNSYGQLGDGTTTNRTTPVAVSGLSSGVAAVTAGGNSTCAIATSGAVQCWGHNADGKLGDGTTTNRKTPVAVSGLSSGVATIAMGAYHTCAVTTSGSAKCWGDNYFGQLGDGTATDRYTPVAVSGLSTGVATISVSGDGGLHTCAVTTSGTALCWGYNNWGQLGDGTTTNRKTPVVVSGLSSGVATISPGSAHTCALSTAGAAQCWGVNNFGQLGDGTITYRTTPVGVSGLSAGVASLFVAAHRTCAVTTSGSAQCWGVNNYGQLGDGTFTDRHAPAAVSGLSSGVAAISGGQAHTCVVMTSGGAKCWGANNAGQVGDGTTTLRPTPVTVAP